MCELLLFVCLFVLDLCFVCFRCQLESERIGCDFKLNLYLIVVYFFLSLFAVNNDNSDKVVAEGESQL